MRAIGSPRRAGGARRSGGLCASTVLALAVAVALSARPAHASPEPALKTLIDTVNAAQRAVKGVEGEQGSAARRKLINIVTAAQTKYFHLPLVNCFNYTNFVTAPPDGGPLCCALTPMACAARCDATPGCLAFKYAWYMNTQPTAAQTPDPAPAGQQWTWCILLSQFEISSCTPELRWDPSANFTQVRPSDIYDFYPRYATNSTPQAGSWTIFYDNWNKWLPQNATTNGTDTGYKLPVVVGLSVGLGAPLALALFAVLVLVLLLLLRGRLPGAGRAQWRPDPRRKHDVFLSYRRKELQIADQVHDKLKLAGLRVFFDRSGAMAGQPFERELFNAIREAPVFAPVIALADAQRWVTHDVSAPDYMLAEIMLALHFSRTGRVRLIFPLLVGELVTAGSAGVGGERDHLFSNAQFKAARAALPAVVPTATLELVAAMFNAAGNGEVLHPSLASATVKDLILGGAGGMHGGSMHAEAPEGASTRGELVNISVQDGSHSASLRGLFEMDAVFLYGPEEQSGLVLRYRYAESIVTALKDNAGAATSGSCCGPSGTQAGPARRRGGEAAEEASVEEAPAV